MSVFGFSTEPSSGADFLPIVKYDARAGRIARVDRVDVGGQFVSEPVDITANFKALMDLENIEVGWISFAGGRPDMRLVPIGHELPARPAGVDDKGKPLYANGVRLLLKLTKDCGGEKPIRELAGVAKALLGAIEGLVVEYRAKKAENPGKLPVVRIARTEKGELLIRPVKSGQGATQSTNYVPTFEIVSWAPRGDLVHKPRGGAEAPTNGAQALTNGAQALTSVPPSTGSTTVAPPAAFAAIELAETDDFG